MSPSRKTRKLPRKPRKSSLTRARSVRELAGLVGRSVSTVSQWFRRPDWPFPRQGPWDAAAVAAWVQRTLAPNRVAGAIAPSAADEAPLARLERQAKAQVYGNRALLLRQEYERRAGKLHDVEHCQERRLRQIHAVRVALLDLATLAPALAGRSKEEIEDILAARCDAILKAFAGDP